VAFGFGAAPPLSAESFFIEHRVVPKGFEAKARFLRNVNSGHPGSITSIHAGSCALAFEQLVLMVKQSPGGQGLAREDIHALVRSLVDVVIKFGAEGGRRYIEEIALRRIERAGGKRSEAFARRIRWGLEGACMRRCSGGQSFAPRK